MTSHYQTTRFNRGERLLRALNDLWYWCRASKWTQKEYLQKTEERLYDTKDWAKATADQKAFIFGYKQCLEDANMAERLEHRYFFEGAWRNHEDIQIRLNARKASWGELMDQPSGIFWKETPSWSPIPAMPWFVGGECGAQLCSFCYYPRNAEGYCTREECPMHTALDASEVLARESK